MTSYQTRRLAGRKPLSMIVKNPVYQAYAAKPMSTSLQTTQALDARLSFDATISGRATRDDRETLAGVANCFVVLAKKHCIRADLEAAQAAQMALLRADARVMDGAEVWNFDSEGRQAMLVALDAFEQLVAQVGHGAVSSALITVMELTARGKVHKVLQT